MLKEILKLGCCVVNVKRVEDFHAERDPEVGMLCLRSSEKSFEETETLVGYVIRKSSTFVFDACRTLMERLTPVRAQHPDCSWEELIIAAYLDRVSLSATGFCKPADVGFGPGQSLGQGTPFLYNTYGSACSVVEVDCLTGDHQVLSTDIVMDVGKSLNPAIDIGQIEGAFMQGYGLMVLEQYKVQGDGTLLTRGPGSYKIPSAGNIPHTFNVSLLRESGNPKAVYSSKAVGEPPLLLAASVLSAIHHAIRAARQDEGLNPFMPLNTPATPARIRMACSDRFTRLHEGAEKTSGTRPWFVDL